MGTLWEIDQTLNNIIDMEDSHVDKETGEILKDEDIDALHMAREEKLENIVKYMQKTREELVGVTMFADEFAARKKRLKSKLEWLTGYLQRHMKEGEKFSCAAGSIRWKTSPAVEITGSVDDLPEEFVKRTAAPMKKEIGLALKEGHEVPGARLVNRVSLYVR